MLLFANFTKSNTPQRVGAGRDYMIKAFHVSCGKKEMKNKNFILIASKVYNYVWISVILYIFSCN